LFRGGGNFSEKREFFSASEQTIAQVWRLTPSKWLFSAQKWPFCGSKRLLINDEKQQLSAEFRQVLTR
jgi:hypothetical protein